MTGHYKTHLFFYCTMLITFYRYKKWFNVSRSPLCAALSSESTNQIVVDFDDLTTVSRQVQLSARVGDKMSLLPTKIVQR